jgi:HEAT repeat protein
MDTNLILHYRYRACTLAFVLLLAFAIIPGVGRLHANGWEHGAISFDALVKALEFESPEMRLRAAQSLGARGEAEAVVPLLKCLSKPEENPMVRSSLYIALGKLGGSRAIPALSDCIDQETREELRSDCVTSLGMIGEKSTLPRLITTLEKDPSMLVRSSAVQALGGFSEEAAVEFLSAMVMGDGNRSLRQRAIRALGRTGSLEAVKPLVYALFVSNSDRERLLIVKSLTLLGSPESTEPLRMLLSKTEDSRLRTQIVIALGAIQDGDAYPILLDMLTDSVPAVRYYAVRGLHELGRRDAAGPISDLSLQISRQWEHRSPEEMISDPLPVLADLSFQVAALRAITALDAPRGLEALLLAAQPHVVLRNSAAALKIAEGFYRQRRIAINGLGYTRSRRAAALLAGQAGLKDPDFRLRAVAVRSLGVLGFSDASQKVLGSLNDPQAEVRWTAALVLGRLEDLNAVDPLIKALADINAEVRRQAALSLGFLGDCLACDGLRRISKNDANEAVRIAAAYSIRLLEKKCN